MSLVRPGSRGLFAIMGRAAEAGSLERQMNLQTCRSIWNPLPGGGFVAGKFYFSLLSYNRCGHDTQCSMNEIRINVASAVLVR